MATGLSNQISSLPPVQYHTKQQMLGMLNAGYEDCFHLSANSFWPERRGECIQVTNIPANIPNIPSLFEDLWICVTGVYDNEELQENRKVVVKFSDRMSGYRALSLNTNIVTDSQMKVQIFEVKHYCSIIDDLYEQNRKNKSGELTENWFLFNDSLHQPNQVIEGTGSRRTHRRSMQRARSRGYGVVGFSAAAYLVGLKRRMGCGRCERCRVETSKTNDAQNNQQQRSAVRDASEELLVVLKGLKITESGGPKTINKDTEATDLE